MSKRGIFTLVELLVVIAVIALLSALLLPALAKAKGKGLQIRCLGNLKQIGCALQLYGDDYAGRFPYDLAGTNHGSYAMLYLCPYLRICRSNGVACHYNMGSLTLVENARVISCPSEKSDYYYRHYGWNAKIHVTYGDNIFRVRAPTSIFSWMDAYWHTLGTDAYSGDTSLFVRKGSRHDLGNNILWLDGHANRQSIRIPADIKQSWFH